MEKRFQLKKLFKHWHVVAILLAVYDMVAVNLAYFLALWFRFDCAISEIPEEYFHIFMWFVPIYAAVSVLTFWLLRLYHSIWRFASINELFRVMWGTVITTVIHVVGTVILASILNAGDSMFRMPISYYVIGACLQFLFLLAIRFSYRLVLLLRGVRYSGGSEVKRVMLIGAGNAGQMILRDSVQLAKQNLRICCMIDDNRNKWNRHVEGIPVVGGRYDILANVEKLNNTFNDFNNIFLKSMK